jgi:hypothetical protein
MRSSRYHTYVEQDIGFQDLDLDEHLKQDFENAIVKLRLMNDSSKYVKLYNYSLFINEKGFIDSLKDF